MNAFNMNVQRQRLERCVHRNPIHAKERKTDMLKRVFILIGAVPKAQLKLNVKNKSDSNGAFGTAATSHR
jgi:hypothetical protein